MTAGQLLDGVREAWQTLRARYGVAPIIYTSARVWQEDLANLPAPDLVESPLWLARYHFLKGPAIYGAATFARPAEPAGATAVGRCDQLVDPSVSGRRRETPWVPHWQCGHEPVQHHDQGSHG